MTTMTTTAVIDVEGLVPVTYMNYAAALKAFVGRHGGAVCTSSNARAVLTWALLPFGPVAALFCNSYVQPHG